MKSKYWSIVAFFLTFVFVSVGFCEWYTNGNLHKSTLRQWKQAEFSNKLATASDWCLAASPKIKNKVTKSGTMDTLKPYATDLVSCIDEAATDPGYDNMSSAEMASLCFIALGWHK